MAESAANCEFFAQEYDMRFSDQHKRDARVTFDILAFSRTDFCYSELFLKAKSRAKKRPSKVKIGQMVHHTVLLLKRTRHLRHPDHVIYYGGSKSVRDAFKPLKYRALYGPSFVNKHR